MAHSKDLIDKYFSQHVDKKTRALFAEWLSLPVDAELKDQILQEQWEKEYYLSPEGVEKSYNSVQKRISSSRNRFDRKFPFYTGITASIVSVVAVVLAFILLRPSVQPDIEVIPDVEMTECYVGNGKKQMILLPDSTSVILNSGSLLIYPQKFSGTVRKVYLTGEAIFRVSADAECPFVVLTPDISIKVHGTTFNVSAYPDAEYALATLKEGSVSVSANGKDEYLLSPNQTFRYSRLSGSVTIEQTDVDDVFSWKDGMLYLKSADIHSIVRSIERYYGIRVYLTTEKYDSEVVTAKFIQGVTVDELFSALSLVIPGMKYTVKNNAVYIR